MAIFVIMGIVGIGIVISTIIVNEIRQTSNVSQAAAAFYAAESGHEKNQYIISQDRKQQKTFQQVLNNLSQSTKPDFVLQTLTQKTANLSKDIPEYRTYLLKDQSLQLDLFDPDSPKGGVKQVDVKKNAQNGWVEITLTEFKNGKEISVQKFLYGPSDPISIQGLNQQSAYRIRLKALYDIVHNIQITVIGTQTEIPGLLNYTSEGKFLEKIQQNITIVAPWTVPLSGLFDFAVFSEETIKK